MIKFRAKTTQGWTVDSPLQPMTFPGGEAHIKVPETFNPKDYEYHIADVRGLHSHELFQLSMWSQVVDNIPYSKYVVFLPYLPAARADRGYPNLWTYTQFIGQLVSPDQLITLDPHSKGWMETFEFNNPDHGKITIFPVERIIANEIQRGTSDIRGMKYQGVIAPDKGAKNRAKAAARAMGVPVYMAGKTRDEATGRLSGFHMEDELPTEGKFLIVDDICDGGGTFIGLAEATGLPKERVDLWVTHGIFSKGFDALEDHFGTIHTTDSYYGTQKDVLDRALLADCIIKVHKLDPYLYPEISL